jgi:hypothetical protein
VHAYLLRTYLWKFHLLYLKRLFYYFAAPFFYFSLYSSLFFPIICVVCDPWCRLFALPYTTIDFLKDVHVFCEHICFIFYIGRGYSIFLLPLSFISPCTFHYFFPQLCFLWSWHELFVYFFPFYCLTSYTFNNYFSWLVYVFIFGPFCSLFTTTCRKLRIMRGSDAAGMAPRSLGQVGRNK